MKLLLPLLFFCPFCLAAQNYFAVDKRALNTPPGLTASIPILANFLCADQPDEAHKARAIYAWITLNIAYVDSTDARELWATPEHLDRQRPARVLQNRTAVCQGYANLFCALAAEAGLRSEVVTGIVKNADGDIEPIGHAWVAARIVDEWRLFDPTWGVQPPGMSRWEVMDRFFMVPPERFVLDHLPDDPMWQLLENPVTERRFRESNGDELLASLRVEADEVFNFRDTLDAWLLMDSVSRMFTSEGRVLRFNDSNDRVMFGLGQSYWGLFFETRSLLDSLSDAAILNDTVSIDTSWYLAHIDLMQRYHERARFFFSHLQSEERIEKSEKFYTPQDVEALLDKSAGDMRIGLFEYLLHAMTEEVLTARQLAQLRYQIGRAEQAYAEAEKNMDCRKTPTACFEVSHNRSLAAIQFAQRQVRFAQDLANDKTAFKNLKNIGRLLREARLFYQQALDDCAQMKRRPPVFEFVDERIATAKQGLFTLRTCEIRAERTAFSPQMEDVLTAQNFSVSRSENLAVQMQPIANSIEDLKDSLQYAARELGPEFVQITRFNLQIENFALQFNLANLRFRRSLYEYEMAIRQNELSSHRNAIRNEANRASAALKEANDALDFLEDSGRMPPASVSQKQGQVNKLGKALRELLAGL